jgi:hypothetical protein
MCFVVCLELWYATNCSAVGSRGCRAGEFGKDRDMVRKRVERGPVGVTARRLHLAAGSVRRPDPSGRKEQKEEVKRVLLQVRKNDGSYLGSGRK